MAQTHKNQKGFSAVETILVVIVVVLIGVAGWLVYKNNHKKTENKTATNTAQTKTTPAKTTPTDTTPQPHVVKMPELGVQFTLPANVMTDFKYIVKDVKYPQFNNAAYPTAYLGTKQLDDMGCRTTATEGNNAPALGFFTKTPGQYPTNANVDNSTGELAKQFSDFYISFRPRGFACFDNNPQGDQLILDETAQVKEAAKSLELIK